MSVVVRRSVKRFRGYRGIVDQLQGMARAMHIKIVVIGLGPAGLTALKALREEGFHVVAFERRDEPGGVTVCNVSKFVSGFSDYPVPKDYPPYLTALQMHEYLDSYASYFNLKDHVHYNTTVKKVIRNMSKDIWDVHVTNLEGDSILSFAKVVFGHGSQSVPVWPSIPNKDKFKGEVIHSQVYKSSEPFRGKRVLVVGVGNTACDISLSLRKHAAKVYQSYRRGKILISRYTEDGVAMDSEFSWPMMRLKYFLDEKMPRLMATVADKITTTKMVSDAARFDPAARDLATGERLKRATKMLEEDWHLLPGPSVTRVHPTVQEDFIPALHEGDVTPLRGIEDFVGDNQVLLEDDTVVEVDAVIFCTGYEADFSIFPELEFNGSGGLPSRKIGDDSYDGTADQGEVEKGQDSSEKPQVPRLFQMIFPPRWASSVAFLSWMAPQEPAWCVCELASMAIAQIWAAETVKSAEKQPPAKSYCSPALLTWLAKGPMNGHSWRQEKMFSIRNVILGTTYNRYLFIYISIYLYILEVVDT
ncbi:FAD/NAD(P)-binding domain-containing protein [Rostrohypoxylon terebratum]|nr:FAD/NAD(P)-binding domain-containing protein [Rostrohypoxylon terebratum]